MAGTKEVAALLDTALTMERLSTDESILSHKSPAAPNSDFPVLEWSFDENDLISSPSGHGNLESFLQLKPLRQQDCLLYDKTSKDAKLSSNRGMIRSLAFDFSTLQGFPATLPTKAPISQRRSVSSSSDNKSPTRAGQRRRKRKKTLKFPSPLCTTFAHKLYLRSTCPGPRQSSLLLHQKNFSMA